MIASDAPAITMARFFLADYFLFDSLMIESVIF